ncbi:hypothetical protein GON26_14475 [Flavobacterium sp. GA093]|uniref:Uncharacterized protein n=1 Tax=Flavobacterium hydrocarbonoxydans TaxID=2683249 RepID=A0A6I4NNB7_9FLAO|nr:hypothetical protein [Flavobacterium hydrocarbonoxydans]MWB95571.1 hypothetical protein [Flavobacterium hydrocarbonoxydans]
MKIFICTLLLIVVNSITAQTKSKDTLYFRLDSYLYQSKFDPKQYIIKDNYDIEDGAIHISELKIVNIPKPKKTLCFKKYAKSSKMYMQNNKKLNEFDVMDLFANYTIVLINKKNEYVHVTAELVIE